MFHLWPVKPNAVCSRLDRDFPDTAKCAIGYQDVRYATRTVQHDHIVELSSFGNVCYVTVCWFLRLAEINGPYFTPSRDQGEVAEITSGKSVLVFAKICQT